MDSASVQILVGVHHSMGINLFRWHSFPIELAGLDPVVTMSVYLVQDTMGMDVYDLKNPHSQHAHQTRGETVVLQCRHLDEMAEVVEEAEEASRLVNSNCCCRTSTLHCCNVWWT